MAQCERPQGDPFMALVVLADSAKGYNYAS